MHKNVIQVEFCKTPCHVLELVEKLVGPGVVAIKEGVDLGVADCFFVVAPVINRSGRKVALLHEEAHWRHFTSWNRRVLAYALLTSILFGSGFGRFLLLFLLHIFERPLHSWSLGADDLRLLLSLFHCLCLRPLT